MFYVFRTIKLDILIWNEIFSGKNKARAHYALSIYKVHFICLFSNDCSFMTLIKAIIYLIRFCPCVFSRWFLENLLLVAFSLSLPQD